MPALCWIWLLAVVGVWLLFRLAGDEWWGATLLLFGPRWVWAAPLIIMLPLMLAVRPRLSWMPLVIAIIAAMSLNGLRWSFSRDEASQCDLRLVTCNIHRQMLDAQQLADFITAVRPDVVALQDWSAQHQPSLFSESEWHLHRAGELFLASRYPIRRVTPLNLPDLPNAPGGRRGSAAHYELSSPRGAVHLINLHLASPHVGLNSILKDAGCELTSNIARRSLESQAVRDAASKLHGPIIIVGDFNTTDDSSIYRAYWSDLSDAFAHCGNGFGHTYVTRRTQLRIDHIFTAASARAVRCWVGPAVGSPHRPMVAELRWP